MCDRITYCDIVECCEACPRYGDDCDGDKRNDDLISRADAIEAVCGVVIDEFDISPTRGYEVAEKALSALPSAEDVIREGYNETDGVIEIEKQSAKDVGEIKCIVIRSPNYTRYFYNESMPISAGPQTGELISREEPTAIRSRTFIPTKDFKEWAERIRDVNPNAIVIPCDAEVVSAEAEEHRIYKDGYNTGKAHASAEAVQGWIPCSERLPKINQRVLLATNVGRVFVGYKEKPDLVWRVTDADGREHWVYDPEHYTDDIDILLKEDDCSFSEDNQYSDGFLSVTSINYDDRFEGVTAWIPLPEPYKGGDDE